MLSCPNCGGNLKFDIPSQQLSCEHCHTLFDPYDFDGKTSDAEESKTFDGDYEVTIFTCPQCGGEILSTDNAAAGFCSFCGASTILYSRISHEKRPNYIIPFQKTKEQCKEAYARRMKHSIFAPKELRDPSYIDSFRGIYMPYWAFYISQKGSLSLDGKKTSRRGDYIITDHYALTGDLDAYYKGLSYDASSSFDDNISEELAPYNLKGMKAFTPAYLSGFYADTSDVDAKVYQAMPNTLHLRKQPGVLLLTGHLPVLPWIPSVLNSSIQNRNHRQHHVSGMVSILPQKRPCRLCNGQRTDRTGRCGYSD